MLCGAVSAVALFVALGGARADGDGAPAEEAPQALADGARRELEVSASTGILNGEAREFVYDSRNGRTVSRLDWDFENVSTLTAGAAWAPSDWFRFALKGSVNLSTSSNMADYDWNIGGCPPDGNGGDFCESFTAGTRLNSAYMLDASVRLHDFALGGFTIAPVAGFKWDYFSWRAYNGVSNYAGVFNDGLGISYEQWWKAPYIGLELSRSFGKLDVVARGIFSDWGQGHDRDHHHSRSLVFTDSFDHVRTYGADIGLRYALSDRIGVTLDYSMTSFEVTRGPGIANDLAGGISDFDPGDAAGASNRTHLVSLGVNVDLSPRPLQPAAEETVSAPQNNWSGPYAGAAVSAFWHDVGWSTLAQGFARASSAELDNFSPGASVFAGWNWQSGHLIWGAEAEIGRSSGDTSISGIPGTAPPAALPGAPDTVVAEQGWNGSLRLRGGVLLSPAMLAYVTGGFAYEHQYAFVSCSAGGPWCAKDGYAKYGIGNTGWTVGGGLEAFVTSGVFVRGEYRFTDYGAFGHTFLAETDAVSARVDTSDQRLTLGAGVRF